MVARIRTIKPEFPQSESMGRVSRDARLTFVQMWTLADDSGRLRGNSRMLASLLFPYDDDAPELISSWLEELEREDCIIRYSDETGASYIQIKHWKTHQKIDKPSESKLPEPQFANVRESSRSLAKNCSGSRIKEGIKDQGEDQGSGVESTREFASKKVADDPPDVDEVANYIASIGKDTSEAQKFCDYYAANGWVQGTEGKPIKDWQAQVRIWFSNEQARNRSKRNRDGIREVAF